MQASNFGTRSCQFNDNETIRNTRDNRSDVFAVHFYALYAISFLFSYCVRLLF
jgi:hypothetical protein